MKAAVVCSRGIGDGLIMMVASHRLRLEGYEVTTFQDLLHQLSPFFPEHHFSKRACAQDLDEFDRIILQYSPTPFVKHIVDTYRHKLNILYVKYKPNKHPLFTPADYAFDCNKPMTHNTAEAIASILQSNKAIMDNGIVFPQHLIHRKHSDRILIHPTSSTPKRTYSEKRFLNVAKLLRKLGHKVAFCVSPDERKKWAPLVRGEYALPEFPTLKDLAHYIYESHFLIGNESGTGHLASNLSIPTLTVAASSKQMQMWRPGFLLGKVVTPPFPILNIKGLRLRNKLWKYHISPRRIIREFFR